MRSAWLLLPDTKPNSGIRAKYGVPARSKLPPASTWAHSARTSAGSRPTRSNTNRSKLEAREMSMEGLEVVWVRSRLRGA